MDTRIYVAAHKQFKNYGGEGYIPLHVGKKGNIDLGYIGDDTGDNISEKNKNYCELTGLYWMWKNVECDVIGLCHYRRYFIDDSGDIAPIKQYENILADYDVIIAASGITGNYETVRNHYNEGHNSKDLEMTEKIIRELYPEYEDALNLALDSYFLSCTNMIVAPKHIFDSYCEWLFDILFELEKRIDISLYDVYQARVFGFISERLLRVWLMKQSYSVYEMKYKQVE